MLRKINKNMQLFLLLIAAFFVALILFSLADLYSDFLNHTSFNHIILELLIIIALSLLSFFGLIYFYSQNNSIISLTRDNIKKIESLNETLSKGISQKIHNQFVNWELTISEVDICLLLLKGFSAREIAVLRKSSLSTVKEHISSIYRKSALKNRSQLSSFFLEDFLSITEDS